jgi:hypothetical protein
LSTYFYLVCNDCKQYSALASRSGSGVGGLVGDEWIRPFAVAHCDHDIEVMSEYREELVAFSDVGEICGDEPASYTAALLAVPRNGRGP